MPRPSLSIVPYANPPWASDLASQVNSIFFAASGRTFASDHEREAFRERWLARYLRGGSDIALVAIEGSATVAGYLVGAVANPATQDRFKDISYFRTDFASLTLSYPAHLHINLAPAYRNQGLGARLIETFATRAAAAGAAGMHAVTGRGMRNVRFYVRCGFAERGSATWNGREIVFLARELATSSGGA